MEVGRDGTLRGTRNRISRSLPNGDFPDRPVTQRPSKMQSAEDATRQSRSARKRRHCDLSPSSSDSDTDMAPAPPVQPSKPDVTIGLDLGTTNTTIGYVTKLFKEPRTVERYPGDELNDRMDGRQVPTEVVFLAWPQGGQEEGQDDEDEEDYDEEDGDEEEEEGQRSGPKKKFKIRYGYRAQKWARQATDQDGYKKICHLQRIKLLLDGGDKEEAADDMARLRQSLDSLIRQDLIKKDTDIIVMFLTWLFEHAKKQIYREQPHLDVKSTCSYCEMARDLLLTFLQSKLQSQSRCVERSVKTKS
jgi:hypothetical protein